MHLTQDVTSETRYDSPQRVYVNGDLRDLSQYPDRSFDRVGCISTLEHIGCDNTDYGGTVEADPASVARVDVRTWGKA